jgi:hypothetical protein
MFERSGYGSHFYAAALRYQMAPEYLCNFLRSQFGIFSYQLTQLKAASCHFVSSRARLPGKAAGQR